MTSLDGLIQELDDRWRNGPADHAFLLALLTSIPESHSATECREIIVELCASDLEHRWRFAKKTAECHQESSPTTSTDNPSTSRVPSGDAWNATPFVTASDYQNLIPSKHLHPSVIAELVLAEWEARSRFGDRPSIDDFARYSSSYGIDESRLHGTLDQVARLMMIVRGPSGSVNLEHLPPTFTLGRQQRGQSVAPSWIEHEKKLVIANREDTRVSRKQAAFRRTRLSELELCNVSKHTRIQFGKDRVMPGQTIRLEIPLEVRVLDANMKIDLVKQ